MTFWVYVVGSVNCKFLRRRKHVQLNATDSQASRIDLGQFQMELCTTFPSILHHREEIIPQNSVPTVRIYIYLSNLKIST